MIDKKLTTIVVKLNVTLVNTLKLVTWLSCAWVALTKDTHIVPQFTGIPAGHNGGILNCTT